MEVLGFLPSPTWPYLAAPLAPGPRWGLSRDAEVGFSACFLSAYFHQNREEWWFLFVFFF